MSKRKSNHPAIPDSSPLPTGPLPPCPICGNEPVQDAQFGFIKCDGMVGGVGHFLCVSSFPSAQAERDWRRMAAAGQPGEPNG